MKDPHLKGSLPFEGETPSPLEYLPQFDLGQNEFHHQAALFSWLNETARMQTDPSLQEDLERIYHVPNGAYVHRTAAVKEKGIAPLQARKLKAAGQKSGVPDICCDAPRGLYHGLRIEMKRPKKYLEPEQKRYRDYYLRVGFRHEMCRTWTQAAHVLVDYFALTRYQVIPKFS